MEERVSPNAQGASIDGFWGKLRLNDSTGSVESWLPLTSHCLDVAVVFRRLLDLPVIRQRMSAVDGRSLTNAQCDRLAVFAFLHDLGKCNTGFQARKNPRAREVAGHVLEVQGLFTSDRLPGAFQRLLCEMADWFTAGQDQVDALLLASISHHGRPVSANDLDGQSGDPRCWWRPNQTLDPMHGVEELVAAVRRAFPGAFETAPPINATPAFQHRFAGLLMLADWIGSDTRYFPHLASPDEDRAEVAARGAHLALARIGLVTESWRRTLADRELDFQSLFGRPPYPLQRALAQDLPLNDDARLLLIESETGSGKTEAALAWFYRLFANGRVDSLYFALPTRVAARELYGRIDTSIKRVFPESDNRPSPVLLAVPGYTRADGEPAALPNPIGLLWPDQPDDALTETVWAAEHPKRFLAAPVAVGTIDQALLSALQVKHAHLRSVCLDRALLVVDEVHASDPYMREILAHLLEGHTQRGGYAVLLSATLGEAGRERLLHTPRVSLEDATARPYPLISTRQRELPQPDTGREKAVHVEFIEALEAVNDLLEPLFEAVRQGARILVVCNTVARANALHRAIENDARIAREHLFGCTGVACPHHGRFARADREVLDAEITRRLGPGSPPGALLAIGTQTLEQSLDIDADWLISDPCPMDVFLQRLGRLHRHRRAHRPDAYRTPRATMLIPAGGDFAPYLTGRDGDGRGPAGIGPVYPDLRILQCTLDALRDRPNLVIPRDNRGLVEVATHPDALARLTGGAWDRHAHYITGTLLAEIRQAELGRLETKPFGECHFPAKSDARITTRLGTGSYTLPLATPMASPFGRTIEELAIPAHLLPGEALQATLLEAHHLEATPDGFRFTLMGHAYRYTRFGLEKDDA